MLKMILVLLLFISTLEANTQGSAPLQKVSIQLQWLDQFQFAGYYMAKEKGFYKEAGLDVEIKKYVPGMSTITEVQEKRATYAIGRPALIIDKNKGRPITLLFSLFQSSPLVVLAREDSKITRVEDFIGKTMMSNPDAVSAASIKAMLNRHDIKDADLNIIPHTHNINDLIVGKVDLMTVYLTNQTFRLEEAGVKYRVFNPTDYGFDAYSDLLFTSEDEVEQHPNRARAFRNASLKGWEYAFNHIDESIRLIEDKYNGQNKSYAALKYEAITSKRLAYLHTNTLGYIDPAKIQRIYDMYNVMGMVNKKINIDKFIFEQDKQKTKKLILSQKHKSYLKNKDHIKMCVVPNKLPFSSIVDKHFIGMNADYIDLVSKYMGTKFVLVPTASWNESLAYVKSRKCDILPISQDRLERSKLLNLSQTVFSTSLVIATKNKKRYISSLDTVMDKKLGFTKGHSFIKRMKQRYPHIKIIEVKSTKEGLAKVASGELYGHVGDLASLSYSIQKHYVNDLKISGEVHGFIDTSIAVRSDDELLLEIIDNVISHITEAQKQKIYNKWLNIKYEKHVDYNLLIMVSIIFISILSFISYLLVRQNRLKLQIQALVDNLEKRVKEEVEKNAKKDKQMFYQSRLAQMGEMLSMIAHQWRQPLSAIAASAIDMQLNMELNVYNLQKKEEIKGFEEHFTMQLNHIETYVQGLTQTINDFRDFYKPNRDSQCININGSIIKALDIIKVSLITSNIELIEDYQSTIEIDLLESEFMQVVLNILKNAQDNFSITNHKDAQIIISTEDTQEGVLFTISDNAGGIPSHIIEKVFDPYFSTKEDKNGTGLGLYMSKMIIEDHHKGSLTVVNKKSGACFIIKLQKVL